MQTQNASRFRPELQSLRGIAALCVAVHHSLMAAALSETTHAYIDIALNAHASVILFFVLSGYVLTLSLRSRDLGLDTILPFYVRRAFRIYPALWTVIAIALVVIACGMIGGGEGLSAWFLDFVGRFYSSHSLTDLARILLGLQFRLDPPMWSIFVELVGSLLLPWMLYAMRVSTAARWIVLLCLAALSLFVGHVIRSDFVNLALTFNVYFAMGALVAMENPLARLRHNALLATGAVSALVLVFFRAAINALQVGQLMPITYRYADVNLAMVEGVAAAVLIASIVARPEERWLSKRPLVWLGDISYSVYLVHFPLLFLAMDFLMPALGFAGTQRALLGAAFVIACVLPLSVLIYRYVELPAIAAGREVVRRVPSLSGKKASRAG